jgi:Bacterial HORMA domain 2
MSTSTFVISYANTVTYVTAKILLVLKEIIRDIGLDPSKFTKDWETWEDAISTWIASRHLQRITLEVYDPANNGLVTRWDISVVYSTVSDGRLWVDTAAVRYAIAKAGLAPSFCLYDIIVTNAPGRPEVPGWQSCEFRATEGFKRYSVGATVGGNGLHAQTAYWSR